MAQSQKFNVGLTVMAAMEPQCLQCNPVSTFNALFIRLLQKES